MNSRSVNENLVNFANDLTSLNQLDTKEPLLSFPFDHIYACHSEGADRRESLQLDKEVEISTHCVVAEDKHIAERLASLENQNKKLKDLLIYHLDLIQQQNDLMSKREKVYQALKQENDTLKSKVTRSVDRKIGIGQRLNPPPLVHVPSTATVTSSTIKSSDVPSSSSQGYFNSFNDLLLTENSSISNPYLCNTEFGTPKPYGQDTFDLVRTSQTVPDLPGYMPPDMGVPSILEGSTLRTDNFTMIDNKRTAIKKEPKASESATEPRYTVTTSGGNPIIQKIQRNRKKPSGLGSLSRMPRNTPKAELEAEPSNIYDDDNTISVNKKTKMINTYSKSRSNTSKYPYTGSLSERLQLIDTTPTGEDPYQIGEAEMREQSPIPKLMLQKTNHGRMKICSEVAGGVTSTITSATPTRRIYDTVSEGTPRTTSRTRPERVSASNVRMQPKKELNTMTVVDESDIDIVKAEFDSDWRIYPTTSKPIRETSLCDFSYGETSANLATQLSTPLLDISRMSFTDLFEPSPVNADSSSTTEVESAPEKNSAQKSKKRGARTTSLAGHTPEESSAELKRGADSKRGRKRALSTAATIKRENAQKAAPKGGRVRACRGKKTPVPGMTTQRHYHTSMGDPDLSWYLGLDPDIKKEDCEHADSTTSNVEVPRWREKSYTSLYSLEGTENLDDKVFEKRHQKLEAEERRQLRWHMRRVREQRHVERLRQRQRDPWGPSAATSHAPANYTVWPQPVRDLQYIEITETLPVVAFGEDVPDLPESYFVLPWVRTSKALKRSKRSKTLH